MIAANGTFQQPSQVCYAITAKEIFELGRKLNYTAFKVYLYFKTQSSSSNEAIRFQPTEVMQHLGISRSTLRKAMTALEGLLPFRFKPIREWELQFQGEEAEIAETEAERRVDSSRVSEMIAEPETTSQVLDLETQGAIALEKAHEIQLQVEDDIAEDACDSEEMEAEQKCDPTDELWENKILQELKSRFLAAETLEELKELKQSYGGDRPKIVWNKLLTAEERNRINAIVERDEQKQKEKPNSAEGILQPGAAIQVWNVNSGWVGGYFYLRQADTLLHSNQTGNLEVAHEVNDSSGRVLRIAASDLRQQMQS